jgi:hypothetical protein
MAARHGRLGWAFLGAVIVKDGEIIGRPIVDRIARLPGSLLWG